MRAVLIVCLLARVAAADRQHLAETRDCREVPAGAGTTQLVGDHLYLLRDDGMEWNALWVVRLTPAPVVEQRIAFQQMDPRAFRVEGGKLYVVGSLPIDTRGDQGPSEWIFDTPRVIVVDAATFAYEPHEDAAGFPACSEPPAEAAPMKAARAGDTTVVSAHWKEPWPGRYRMLVLRDGNTVAMFDHHPLELENLGSFCSTLPPSSLDHQQACGARAVADATDVSRFDFLAIRWGVLISTSHAGVTVHDLTTQAYVGGVARSELQGMLPTISLK
jgi:hypothetical protein